MIITQIKSCCLAACILFCVQSLADAARKEAERRTLLDQQGIEAKVINADGSQSWNGAVSTGTEPTAPKNKSEKSADRESRKSPAKFRTDLRKLDRAIRECEARLASRRARLQSAHWENPKSRSGSRRGSTQSSQDRLQTEIEDLEIKLNQLRQERSEVYSEGIKAGFLPGDLDGKGIIP